MRKILVLLAMALLTACASKTYLEESKEVVEIPFTITYDTSSEGVRLTWSVIWDNTTFQVFRGTNQDELPLYNGKLYQTNWVDTGADPGTEYFYTVKAFTQSGRYVGYTPVLKGYRSYQDYATMNAPTEFSADQNKYGDRITLYWYGDKESRFRIYRADAAAGPYKLLAETGGVKYLDTNVSPMQKKYYKISSVGKDHTVVNPPKPADSLKERFFNSSTAGADSLASGVYVEGSTADSPVGVKATDYTSKIARTGAIQVSWNWDNKAEYYRIYRSLTEEGDKNAEYKLIALFVNSTTNLEGVLSGYYNDKSMPDTKGSLVEGKYVYPSYFYRVSAIKNSQESELSAPAKGSSVDKQDVLPAPENVQVKIKTQAEPGFDAGRQFPVINSATGKYTLEVTWSPLPSGVTADHTFNISSSNMVTGDTAVLVSGLAKDIASYTIDNPDFNQEIRYSVAAANMDRGGLEGNGGNFLYRSVTPMPPNFHLASQLKRLEKTNETDTDVRTHTQYKTGTGKEYIHRNTGSAIKTWTTEAIVGDVDLEFTPIAAKMQQSYNIYRRKKTADNSALWELVVTAAHSNDIDNPELAVKQVAQDKNFTAAQLKGSGTVNDIKKFYPVYQYLVTALSDGIESALSTNIREGQAIDPKDILPAPSYLSVPFHFASGTGIAFWSFGWTVKLHSSASLGNPMSTTTGLDQILGKGGSAFETQRIFITWDPIAAPAGSSFDYRFRHVRSAFVALDTAQHAQPNYLLPGSWYTHGGMGTQTWIKLNNETTEDYMTYMYDVVDSGIGGIASAPTYNPGSTYFAVSATNKNAGGLDGNTIGILFTEAAADPYGSPMEAPKNVRAELLKSGDPYQLKLSWDPVSGAGEYNVYAVTVSGAGAEETKEATLIGTAAGTSYTFTPDSEFILGTVYNYYVIAGSGGGEPGVVNYTHNTPYKPTLVAVSTNKVTYTTNINSSINTITWIENETFADGANNFNKSKRNTGAVIKEWVVTASGGTVDLELSYSHLGTSPDSYKIYRGTSIGSWTTQFTVPVNKTAPLNRTVYTDTVPGPGKYYYNISAVYKSTEGAEIGGSEENAGVALDSSKLSPPPSYLSVPFHWAFGSKDGGYTGPINKITESPAGIDQISGETAGGQALWLAWAPVAKGSAPEYAARVAQGVSDIPAPASFDTVALASPSDTKIMISNHAGTGKTALYSESETARETYKQDTAAFDVTVSNTFADSLGNTVTLAGSSRGLIFYESSDPYTEGELSPTASVTAVLDKEAYISQGRYNLNITWQRVNGAGAYTLIQRKGGTDTVLFTTNAPASNPSSYTYAYNASLLTLGDTYDFVVVSTNLSPVKKGGSNYTAYAHYTPKPPVVRSITTNDQTETTNLQSVAEPVHSYWNTGSGNYKVGQMIRKWHITQPNKGIISLTWAKADAGETFDFYKIYRTSTANSPAGINGSHNPAGWAAAPLLTTADKAALSHRDNTMTSMSSAQRQGSGTPFQYPVYYYRITAVKVVGGIEYESLPSFYTNGGAAGIAAGGSAINPDDVYGAPAFVNVVFDYAKSTGFGNYNALKGTYSPEGFDYFGTRKRGGLIANYPPNPLWIAWGYSDNAAARYWARDHFRSSSTWPGWGNFTMNSLNYSGGNTSTTYKSSQASPTANHLIEYSNSGSLNGGNPVSKLYDICTRTGGVGFEVTSVNISAQLGGLPLRGESRGVWYHQVGY